MFDSAKGGNDVFSFGADNGHDTIFDFGQDGAHHKPVISSVDGLSHGTDVIEITWGPKSFKDLTFTQAFDPGTHTSVIAGSDAGSDITVVSDHALTTHDFVFHLELR
jgi:hypothetical protein